MSSAFPRRESPVSRNALWFVLCRGQETAARDSGRGTSCTLARLSMHDAPCTLLHGDLCTMNKRQWTDVAATIGELRAAALGAIDDERVRSSVAAHLDAVAVRLADAFARHSSRFVTPLFLRLAGHASFQNGIDDCGLSETRGGS